jgi:hypothetical protein
MIRHLVPIFLFIPAVVLCQTGDIRGQVTDAHSGDALVGARITIESSKPGHGAATDLNGMFLIRKLPPGEYTVKAAYVDYKTITQQHVTVGAGQTTEISFAMRKEGDPEPADNKSVDTLSMQKGSTTQDSSGAIK